jgi:hypothetical protein
MARGKKRRLPPRTWPGRVSRFRRGLDTSPALDADMSLTRPLLGADPSLTRPLLVPDPSLTRPLLSRASARTCSRCALSSSDSTQHATTPPRLDFDVRPQRKSSRLPTLAPHRWLCASGAGVAPRPPA